MGSSLFAVSRCRSLVTGCWPLAFSEGRMNRFSPSPGASSKQPVSDQQPVARDSYTEFVRVKLIYTAFKPI